MLKDLVSEKHKEVTLREIFTGEKNHGGFDTKFILSTEGSRGEQLIYISDSYSLDNTLNLRLVFIVIEKNVYTNYYSPYGELAKELENIVDEFDMNIIELQDITNGFLERFYNQYIDFLIKSSRYEKYKKENIDKVRKEQHDKMLKGGFDAIDVRDNLIEKRFVDEGHRAGVQLTLTDKISYYNNNDLILELVEEYYNKNYIYDDKIMYANLYNELLEEERSKDVLQIKEKVDALKKAGKTANILVGGKDEWVKVDNRLHNGDLRSSVGWEYYPLDDIEAIKFGRKILYSNNN